MNSFRQQFDHLNGPAEQLRWLGEHRLLGVADLLAERELIPESLAQMSTTLTRKTAPVTAEQMAAESRVMTGFVEADVQALALKGCLLGFGYYPKPNQRWRADQDVLVAPESVDAARETLRSLGYRPMWEVAGGTPMDQESWLHGHGPQRRVVDLHWGLRNHPVLRGVLSFEEQWAAAIPLKGLGKGVMGQGPVHALINASMHWFDDLYDQLRPLGWLLDKDLLWRSLDESGHSKLIELACERGVAGLLAASLSMTRDVFATPIPDKVIDHLTEAGRIQPATPMITANSNPWRAYWFALRCEPGLGRKIRRVRASLFPSPAHMRQRYPEGSRLGLPGLYAKRIFRRL